MRGARGKTHDGGRRGVHCALPGRLRELHRVVLLVLGPEALDERELRRQRLGLRR